MSVGGGVGTQGQISLCRLEMVESNESRTLQSDYANWKEREALTMAILPIHTAPSADAAEAERNAFEFSNWGEKFPTVAGAWRHVWAHEIQFITFRPANQLRIYTSRR